MKINFKLFFILFLICILFNFCSVQQPPDIPTKTYFGTLTFNSEKTQFEIDSIEIVKEIDDIIDYKAVKSSRSVRRSYIAEIDLYRVLNNQDTLRYSISYNDDDFAYIYYLKKGGWITGLHSSWDLATLFQNYFLQRGINIEK